MIEIFWSICFIAASLLVWFNSDALIDWGNLFGLYDILLIKEFYDFRMQMLPLSVNYPTFLKNKYNNFLTKLLACPVCLSAWIAIWVCVCFSVLLLSPTFIFMTPIVYVGSLITYGILTNLLKLV